MNFNRTFLFSIVFLYVLIIVSGLQVILIGNAAKYAQVGKEILENNNWIDLTITGDAYMQKPPLLFWIGALSFRLFGVSVYSYKIPVILISFTGIFSTFKLGQLLYNKYTGLLASIFWATCSGYFLYHNDIRTDTLLASVIIFSVWMLALYFVKGEWYYFLFGVIGVGLAMLTKGPVGLAVIVFAIGTDLIFKRKYKEIFHPRWFAGAIIIFIIITPALIGLKNQFGLDGIKFYFWTNNMGRITGSYLSNSNDPFFYIQHSFYMLAPWTFMAIAAILLEIVQKFKTKGRGSSETMTLGAIILYSLIISVSKAKYPHYILVIMPFIFILTAKWSLEIYSNVSFTILKRILSVLNRIMAVILVLIGILFPIYFFPENTLVYWIIVGVLLIVCCYFLVAKTDLKKQIIMLGIANTFLMLTLNVNILPNMMHYQTSNIAVNDFNSLASSEATLNQYKWGGPIYELFLYSKNPGKCIRTQESLKEFLPRKGAWFYTTEEGYFEMRKMNIKMTIIRSYKKPIRRKSIKFLNPRTRKQFFENRYLVRLD